MSTRKISALLLVLAGAGTCGWAAFTSSYVAPFHGAPCTEYSAFESFTQAWNAPNFPDDPATTSPDTALVQLVQGAIITPQGNIDHLTLPPSFVLSDSVPADLQEVVFQLCILLNQFNWTSVVLEYTDAGGTLHSIAPNSSVQLVFLMGREERVIRWDLSAVPDVILAYQIRFSAQFPSTTLDAIKLDTRFACQPGIVFCAGDGTGAACPCAQRAAPAAVARTRSRRAAGARSDGHGLRRRTTRSCSRRRRCRRRRRCCSSRARRRSRAAPACRSATACAAPAGTRAAGLEDDGRRRGLVRARRRDRSRHLGPRRDPSGGATRSYQGWYRNAAAYCTSATFNLSNGLRIDWS